LKKKIIERDKNLEKRIDSCILQMKSLHQEIDHHGLDFSLDKSREKYKILVNLVKSLGNLLN